MLQRQDIESRGRRWGGSPPSSSSASSDAFGLHVHDAEPRARMARPARRASAARPSVDGSARVGAPAAGVLGDEHDLLARRAPRARSTSALRSSSQGKAAVAPADEGDGAVGAEAVAPVGYLHVGRDRLGLGLLHACGAGQALVSLCRRPPARRPPRRSRPTAASVPAQDADASSRAGSFGEQALEHGCQVVLAGCTGRTRAASGSSASRSAP